MFYQDFMSNTILQFSPTPSSAPTHFLPKDINSQLAENQLLAELARAAEEGMVSTRSHDHALDDVDSNLQSKTVTPAFDSKKRNLDKDENETSKESEAKRRRRTGEAIAVVIKRQNSTSKRRSGRAQQTRPVESEITEIKEAELIPGGQTGPIKAAHKRFGSEDAEEELPSEPIQPTIIGEEDVLEDDELSDDDAPEAVTAAAGFEASRAAAVETAKIAEIHEAALRAKRREHDARLKVQAEAAKLHRQPKVKTPKKTKGAGAASPTTGDEDVLQQPRSITKKSTMAPLPALLPDELLAAEPIVRPPTPPSSIDKHIFSSKMKLLSVEPKPPKDLKRGNKKIRVLQIEKSVLPPKSSAASKAIRETWLTGQRGLDGGTGVPRRKMGGGFIRR